MCSHYSPPQYVNGNNADNNYLLH